MRCYTCGKVINKITKMFNDVISGDLSEDKIQKYLEYFKSKNEFEYNKIISRLALRTLKLKEEIDIPYENEEEIDFNVKIKEPLEKYFGKYKNIIKDTKKNKRSEILINIEKKYIRENLYLNTLNERFNKKENKKVNNEIKEYKDKLLKELEISDEELLKRWLIRGFNKEDAMNIFNLKRYCCRVRILSQPRIEPKLVREMNNIYDDSSIKYFNKNNTGFSLNFMKKEIENSKSSFEKINWKSNRKFNYNIPDSILNTNNIKGKDTVYLIERVINPSSDIKRIYIAK